jgi:predicted DNA-binding transcriptional regulator AlpA
MFTAHGGGQKMETATDNRLSLGSPVASSLLEGDTLLCQQQVCSLLGISRRTLFDYVEEGKLPQPIRLSSKWLRWRLSTLREFIRREDRRAQKAS